MIEVNLLPGAKKGKRTKKGGGAGINFAAIGASIAARVKDTWLAAAVVIGIVALLAIGFLFTSQQRRESVLKEEEQKQVADSTRYAAALLDKARAQARRDTALVQLAIIKAIDEERYIWPHVLEEVSRALPIYTWLRVLNFTGNAQGLNPATSIKPPPPDTGKARGKKRKEIVVPRDTIRIRLQGRTVDLQAFTRFMRSLEDSPFFEAVKLQRSEPTVEGGKDLTQFTLEMQYTRPDTLLLRRVPFTTTTQR